MVSKLPQEFKKYQRYRNQLRQIFKETQRTLEIIDQENFFPEEDILSELMPALTVEQLTHLLDNEPRIIIFGQDCKSKAALINRLLETDILPLTEGNWRWIRFGYGQSNSISLSVGLEYEVVDIIQTIEKPWNKLTLKDLNQPANEDPNYPTVLEINLAKSILKDGIEMLIIPNVNAIRILSKGVFNILPIFVYTLSDYPLNEKNFDDLRELKETYPYNPILFVSSLNNVTSLNTADADLTESEQHTRQNQNSKNNEEDEANGDDSHFEINSLGLTWLNQLNGLGFLHLESDEVNNKNWMIDGISNDFIESYYKINRMVYFVKRFLQNNLVNVSNYLNEIQTTSVRKFILSAFDMAREIQITPKRIQYVQQKENELYNSLMNVINKNQDELTVLIQNIIQKMKDTTMRMEITDGCDVANDEDDENEEGNDALDDCESKVSNYNDDSDGEEWFVTVKTATTQVQRLVLNKLSEKVARKLVTSVNCLRETFLGTLERCLLELEKTYDNDGNLLASDALKQILSAAYNVELDNSSPSLIHSFLERIRQFLKSLPLPWQPTPKLDINWKKRVTLDVLNSLSANRLARTISTQFKDKIKSSHDSFHSALKSLENYYNGKLERTEEQRIAIRKIYAPKLAKLLLESTSMGDIVRYGIPNQGKEIGRGQYGVVFSCDYWPGVKGPCAVKSVVPPDERHWNDLAMEFYYTRSIPDHKRIVKLRGSIIDYTYGNVNVNIGGNCLGGMSGAAVLLITDRMVRDLYCGIRSGLDWIQRIQISIDVLEGIRYLHSQGLVHRDIKLKNILLDHDNRGKLTDLGFCITEAMMSGSVVGTPVHMAPELLSGHYDSSVDVYAFGILFWYICAGHTKMPFAFEQFHNKEQLWTSVRKGLRPERLSTFSDDCWNLMEQCWSGEPSKRPVLGVILPILEKIRDIAELGKSTDKNISKPAQSSSSSSSSPSSSSLITRNSPAILSPTLPGNLKGNNKNNASPLCRKKSFVNIYPSRHIMTNFLQTTGRSNFYIQMREFS